jgi:hypothetical protein
MIKVDDDQFSVFVDHDIIFMYIVMHDPAAPQVLKALDHLLDETPQFYFLNYSAGFGLPTVLVNIIFEFIVYFLCECSIAGQFVHFHYVGAGLSGSAL